MPKQKRCPYCLRLFIPDPRRKERQATCGRQECRRKRKRQSDKQWRSQHPDYFHGIYQQQKKAYGTRAEYKKQYRRQNPDYVRRNAAFVRKYRKHHRSAQSIHVSHTSPERLRNVLDLVWLHDNEQMTSTAAAGSHPIHMRLFQLA
jgi:hypothetical protein